MTATPSASGPASPLDALRFAFGTLTVLPVRVSRWDRAAARGGMIAAPLVGVVVGLCAAVAGAALLRLGASPLVAAVAAVAVPAALTRGLHLDGLADTADGLGSGKPAQDALRVMKQSDIGPFGVLVLVLVLLAQVAAAADGYGQGALRGGGAVVAAAVAGRGAMTLGCRGGVPAARADGLGAAVASAVPRATAACVALLCAALAAAAVASWRGALAAVLALLCAELLLRRCVRRLGGVTGDVFGALCEAATTATYVALTLH
ncbi:adenosylcobinamide-GDP ribazoletransferase [Streptomyces sp. V4-01]|uniref:Adenosylcobinamide-GDP ribazoletransferase n=1 Tax=Actinacidiphila polyblastidii TaxID=3110430 RepID=A0ABU7PE85_9ACTN|nr:adenosylcobinamide-GDP ribazoletransferase [Streptomyces sp. V4-01]